MANGKWEMGKIISSLIFVLAFFSLVTYSLLFIQNFRYRVFWPIANRSTGNIGNTGTGTGTGTKTNRNKQEQP